MLKALALILNLTVTLTPRHYTEPTVKDTDTRGKYMLMNPLKQAVFIFLGCGQEYDSLPVYVDAGDVVVVEVKTPEGNAEGGCLLDYYKPARKQERK